MTENPGKYKLLFLLLAIAALAILLVSCGLNYGPNPLSAEIQQKLDLAVDTATIEAKSPGVIVGVFTPFGNWIATKGMANTATGDPPRTGDKFRIASVTKTFTATVILQLMDEKKLSLDDTLNKFDLGLTIPNADRITVRQLMNHSSGLFTFDEDNAYVAVFSRDLTRVWTRQELLAIAFSHPVYGAPGELHHYSNTNYFLLGMIIEKVTGHTLAEEMQQRIFTPLKMNDTSLPEGSQISGNYIHGYAQNQSGEVVDTSWQDTSSEWATGGIVSTFNDLAIWARALAKGTLLSAQAQRERTTWFKYTKENNPYDTRIGLGLFSVSGYYGHNGAVPGYMDNVEYDPDKEIMIITMANMLSAIDLDISNEATFVNFNKELAAYTKLLVDLSRAVQPFSFPDVP